MRFPGSRTRGVGPSWASRWHRRGAVAGAMGMVVRVGMAHLDQTSARPRQGEGIAPPPAPPLESAAAPRRVAAGVGLRPADALARSVQRAGNGADRHRYREGATPAEPSSPSSLAATSAATPEVARLLGGCEGAARVAAKGSSRVAAKKQRPLGVRDLSIGSKRVRTKKNQDTSPQELALENECGAHARANLLPARGSPTF